MAKRKPPIDRMQGPGDMIVGIDVEIRHVAIQFENPEWWIHFTPAEARHLAHLLLKKADDIEAEQQAAGQN